MREMKISVGPDGGVKIEVTGVPGGECLDFTRFLEEELGEVVARERTAEYYQESENQAHQTIQTGGGDDEGSDA